MAYGIKVEGNGVFNNVQANNLIANNANINGTGYFQNFRVQTLRRVTLNFRDHNGNTYPYSGTWDLSGDLNINFGCVGNCSGSCMNSCHGGCSTGCNNTCTGGCNSTCSYGCISSDNCRGS